MIRIITDSTCEAPDALLKHPAVSVLPLSVVFGQTSLRDGIDITREEFWQRLPAANPLPTTSQATPGDFLALFTQFTAAGDEVIAVTLSAKLSGTYDSAIERPQQPAQQRADRRHRLAHDLRRPGFDAPGGGEHGRGRRVSG